MKRRGKMLFRALCWTCGVVLGFYIRRWTDGDPSLLAFGMFWSGMMLAAVFVHFDPPEIETWERSQ